MKTLHPKRTYNLFVSKMLGELEDHEIYSLAYARLLSIESVFKHSADEAIKTLTEYQITEEMLEACEDEGVHHALELWKAIRELTAHLEDYWCTTPEYEE